MYFQSVFINTFVVIANMATKWQAIAVFFVALSYEVTKRV